MLVPTVQVAMSWLNPAAPSWASGPSMPPSTTGSPSGSPRPGGGTGAQRRLGGRVPDARELPGAGAAHRQELVIPAPAVAVEHARRRRGHRVGPPLAGDQLEKVVLGAGEAARRQRRRVMAAKPAQFGGPVADVARAECPPVTVSRRDERVDLRLLRRRPGIGPQDDLADAALAAVTGPGGGQAARGAGQDERRDRGGQAPGHVHDAAGDRRAHVRPRRTELPPALCVVTIGLPAAACTAYPASNAKVRAPLVPMSTASTSSPGRTSPAGRTARSPGVRRSAGTPGSELASTTGSGVPAHPRRTP